MYKDFIIPIGIYVLVLFIIFFSTQALQHYWDNQDQRTKGQIYMQKACAKIIHNYLEKELDCPRVKPQPHSEK